MCAAPVAIKGCCGVNAGLPGTKKDQIPRVPGGKRCGTSPTWLRDGVMKVDYMCTSIAKRRGEMRAPPAEKQAAAARASRCAGPCRYTGPSAGCPGQCGTGNDRAGIQRILHPRPAAWWKRRCQFWGRLAVRFPLWRQGLAAIHRFPAPQGVRQFGPVLAC